MKITIAIQIWKFVASAILLHLWVRINEIYQQRKELGAKNYLTHQICNSKTFWLQTCWNSPHMWPPTWKSQQQRWHLNPPPNAKAMNFPITKGNNSRIGEIASRILRKWSPNIVCRFFLVGVRLYSTSCYHLTESCVFNKHSPPPSMCHFPNLEMGKHPFSRGYEVILPSSFNIVFSSALVDSTCSHVSVWGTQF